MIGCDQPELSLQIIASFLHADEAQYVLVVHMGKFKDLLLWLPGLLVLDGKDLDGHDLGA